MVYVIAVLIGVVVSALWELLFFHFGVPVRLWSFVMNVVMFGWSAFCIIAPREMYQLFTGEDLGER